MSNWSKQAEELRREGVAVIRSAFPVDALLCLRTAANACFEAIARGEADTKKYRFTAFSYSVLLEALRDFGAQDLMTPLRLSDVESLACEVMGEPVEWRLAESWVRKRFAPAIAPRDYRPNSWHQDGGLGVHYGAHPPDVGPITRLTTFWTPLQDCGGLCPGLEFVRQRLDRLLHYSDLNDGALRKCFSTELFWAPDLKLGDGLMFDAGSLHRTHVLPEMRQDRLSVEYRFFPVRSTEILR
jgi:hypothetical protein